MSVLQTVSVLGSDIDRSLLPAPPTKRSAIYQAVVDGIVAFYGTPVVTRAQIVSWLKTNFPEETENQYMRKIRWVTNARNTYRPLGKRTPYVLPYTSQERAELASPAPAVAAVETEPAPEQESEVSA